MKFIMTQCCALVKKNSRKVIKFNQKIKKIKKNYSSQFFVFIRKDDIINQYQQQKKYVPVAPSPRAIYTGIGSSMNSTSCTLSPLIKTIPPVFVSLAETLTGVGLLLAVNWIVLPMTAFNGTSTDFSSKSGCWMRTLTRPPFPSILLNWKLM